MRRLATCGLAAALAAFAILCFNPLQKETPSMAAEAAREPMLAHMVYFTLTDNSDAARQKLVDACRKYLKDHPGTVFFAAGTRDAELSREVNDKDFDVSLNLVFKDRKSHDAYQTAERHKQFIDECKDNWKKVRVFDSDVVQ